jgi:hypothetical protein
VAEKGATLLAHLWKVPLSKDLKPVGVRGWDAIPEPHTHKRSHGRSHGGSGGVNHRARRAGCTKPQRCWGEEEQGKGGAVGDGGPGAVQEKGRPPAPPTHHPPSPKSPQLTRP